MAPGTPKKSRATSDGMLAKGEYKRPKPSFSLTEDDLPAIKDWQVGKKYNMELVVTMDHHSQGEEYPMDGDGDKKMHRARFSIVSIDSMPEDHAGTKKGK